MTTTKQVLRQHFTEHHPALARELPAWATEREMADRHKIAHYRYSGVLDHWHGPQANRGPGDRPDGWVTGEHVHIKE